MEKKEMYVKFNVYVGKDGSFNLSDEETIAVTQDLHKECLDSHCLYNDSQCYPIKGDGTRNGDKGPCLLLCGCSLVIDDLLSEHDIVQDSSYTKELCESLDNAVGERDELEKTCISVNHKNDELQSELDKVKAENEQMKSIIENNKQLYDKKIEDYDELSERCSKLQSQYEIVFSAAGTDKHEIAVLNKKLSEYQEKIATLEKCLSEKESELKVYFNCYSNLINAYPSGGWLSSADVVKIIQAVKGEEKSSDTVSSEN